MKPYFSDQNKNAITGSTESVIRTIVNRYMKASPAESLRYRAYTEDHFRRERSGCFVVDFNQIFPDAKEEEYAYAYAQYYIQKGLDPTFYFGSRNLTEVYVNGERIAKTDIYEELIGTERVVSVPAKKGYNSIFVKCKKSALGFGFRFGALNHKGNPVEFYKAFQENAGELGWN